MNICDCILDLVGDCVGFVGYYRHLPQQLERNWVAHTITLPTQPPVVPPEGLRARNVRVLSPASMGRG